MSVEKSDLTTFLEEVVLNTNENVFKEKQEVRLLLSSDYLSVECESSDELIPCCMVLFVREIKVNLEKERFEITFIIGHNDDDVYNGYFYFKNCHSIWNKFDY